MTQAEKKAWATTHLVHSEEITLALLDRIGQFYKVEFLRSYSRQTGTGYRNKVYLVNDKWQVTVITNCYCQENGSFFDRFEVEEYAPIVERKKAFGHRVARLAKAAGVPWNIAVMAGNISDDAEAIELLKRVKGAKALVSKEYKTELGCGINRRTWALEKLLGDDWRKLTCKGQKQTTTLAEYLAAE